jgi:hypothetical protein
MVTDEKLTLKLDLATTTWVAKDATFHKEASVAN